MKPLLSILIPTYNRSIETSRALRSILSQLDGELAEKVRVIVSDNASSDDTQTALRSFGENITYIRQEQNIGADANFAYLLENSSSKYKWIFGSDDLLLKGALSSIVSVLETYPDIGLLHIKGMSSLEPSLDDRAVVKRLRLQSNKSHFIEDVSVMIAFITANIFNSELLPSS